MKLFNWNDIEDTSFKDALFQNGAALSIGSFDGPHVGHIELFHSVVEAAKNQSLVPGVVTFRQSLGANKSNGMYKGDVSTLEQRLESFKKHGMQFCVVIDFSVEFGKMDGEQFLGILKNACALKFLAEGTDFRCGYRGRCGKEQIASFASKNGIAPCFLPSVIYNGERVSSSRIRSCVFNADFVSAKNMLGHSYELDCSSILLQKAENLFVADRRHFSQVLPENGIYNVQAITASQTVPCKLYVEPLFLRLEFSTINLRERILAIVFA